MGYLHDIIGLCNWGKVGGQYMKKGKNKELRWRMTRMLVLGWLLPLMLLSISMLLLVASKNSKQIEETILVSTKKAVESCNTKINEAIIASRNASYLSTIKNSYYQYLQDGNTRELYTDVMQFLNQQYKYNDMIRSTMLYFVEQPEMVYYTYSNVAGATYSSVWDFMTNEQNAIQKEAETLGTGIKFMDMNGKLYLIRNMVASNYEPFAVIVMEINTKTLFEKLQNVVWYVDSMVYMDDDIVIDSRTSDMKDYSHYVSNSYSNEPRLQDGEEKIVVMSTKIEIQRFTYVIKLDKAAIVDENDMIIYMFMIFVLFMVPLIIIIFYFFHINVNKPISELVKVSHEIEKGNFGVRLSNISENEEFNYLGETFNSMCTKLQHLFEKIYLEEIALRDANMMALQAQINPHFLNNTLEIINWEARLADNEKVSQMIEALSVMMEATMNRKKESLIPLAEELTYVEAYLYIISARFGSQFEFSKEIDEELLDIKVPRLIIQPIMENAVEHGGDDDGRRKVSLKIYQKEEQVLIEIRNNGVLTSEGRKKITALLRDKQDKQDEKSLNLGIYNVNKRIRIIYGETCGLTIEQNDRETIISTIVINDKPFLQ